MLGFEITFGGFESRVAGAEDLVVVGYGGALEEGGEGFGGGGHVEEVGGGFGGGIIRSLCYLNHSLGYINSRCVEEA